jgi:hypothetical protein
MKKKLEPTGDVMIRLTEDELIELNIKEGDKFDFKPQEDGSIKLEKYVGLCEKTSQGISISEQMKFDYKT